MHAIESRDRRSLSAAFQSGAEHGFWVRELRRKHGLLSRIDPSAYRGETLAQLLCAREAA